MLIHEVPRNLGDYWLRSHALVPEEADCTCDFVWMGKQFGVCCVVKSGIPS